METIKIDNVDVALLKKQRDMLLDLLSEREEDELDGLVHLLDNMLDNSSDNPGEEYKKPEIEITIYGDNPANVKGDTDSVDVVITNEQ